jgi:CelD/BcsL family acetyltransferase involved in cellulose biosynthesis
MLDRAVRRHEAGELLALLLAGVAAEGAPHRGLRAFLAQKAARFAQLGIPDSFGDPAARDFLAALCRPGSNEVSMPLNRPASTAPMKVAKTRPPPVATRACSSPGDLLLAALIRDQAARGRRALDLGVGEARYKASVCSAPPSDGHPS